MDQFEKAAAGDLLLFTWALSRYSRNREKLHRILEFLLACGTTIMTTNYQDNYGNRGPARPPGRSSVAARPKREGQAVRFGAYPGV